MSDTDYFDKSFWKSILNYKDTFPITTYGLKLIGDPDSSQGIYKTKPNNTICINLAGRETNYVISYHLKSKPYKVNIMPQIVNICHDGENEIGIPYIY